MLKIVLKKRASPGSKGHQASTTSRPWRGAGRAQWQPGSGERAAPQGRTVTLCPQASPFISLSLSFLIWKVGKWFPSFLFHHHLESTVWMSSLKNIDIRHHFMKVVSPLNAIPTQVDNNRSTQTPAGDAGSSPTRRWAWMLSPSHIFIHIWNCI